MSAATRTPEDAFERALTEAIVVERMQFHGSHGFGGAASGDEKAKAWNALREVVTGELAALRAELDRLRDERDWIAGHLEQVIMWTETHDDGDHDVYHIVYDMDNCADGATFDEALARAMAGENDNDTDAESGDDAERAS